MVADFSALDAELDDLGKGPSVDATALASSYAGELDRLSQIDAALSELSADVDVSAASYAQTFPASLPSLPSSVPPALVEVPRQEPPSRLDSDEIALPNAMPRLDNDESGELPLDGAAPASGSFALPLEDALVSANVGLEEELTFEADVEDLVELTPQEAAGGRANGLFALHDRESATDHAADADFDALFPEPVEIPTELSYDDTEIFDSSALEFDTEKPALEPIENAFTAEELDSAEFEIVMETESGTQATPSSSIPPHPSTPPEKRPSFLGRLFGRKDE